MKKYLFILFLVTSIFLVLPITGCESQVPGPENYKAGVKEVEVDFRGDYTAYQNKPLTLNMIVQNDLGYSIDNVKVSVVGLDERYVSLPQHTENLGSLEGRDIVNEKGELHFLEFIGSINDLSRGTTEDISDEYLIYVDYLSSMEFSPTVCVGPSLYGIEDGGCKGTQSKDPRNQKLPFTGQGAPLAVTQLEIVSGSTGTAQLRLLLSNRGKGEVGKVTLGSSMLGGRDMNCEFVEYSGSNKKEFTFSAKTKQTEMLCDAVIGGSTTIQTVIWMEFLYDYRLKLPQKLTIRGKSRTDSQLIS